MREDYYETLGVPRTADAKAIKAAYRKRARQFHPDVNKGDKAAEEKFKKVAEAFAVLSDPEKRARYDRGGSEAFGPGFNPFEGADYREFEFGGGNIQDLFDLFTGRGAGTRGGSGRTGGSRRGRRGQDLQFEVRVPFADAVRGGALPLALPSDSSGATRIQVRVPPGIDEGETLRVSGKGGPGSGGAPAGDAFLVVRIEPHPRLRRDDQDLLVDVPVGLAQAALGGTVEVPTIDGSATVTLPAGTASGQKLRLKGRGVPARAGRPAGDLYAVIQIRPPRQLDARSREILEEFARLNPNP